MDTSANVELCLYTVEQKTDDIANAYLGLRDENGQLFLHKTGFKVLLQWKLFHSGTVYATATIYIQDEVLTVVNICTYIDRDL